jgi:hypothetical protein
MVAVSFVGVNGSVMHMLAEDILRVLEISQADIG